MGTLPETLQEILVVLREAQKEYAGHHSSGTFRRLADKLEATLTQQGGEQEAGDVERQARELLAAEYERNGWGAVASRIRDDELAGEIAFHVPYALRAITAALRTKQPAASEGGVDWAKFPYSDAWCDGLSATLWECGMPNAQRQVEEIKDFVRAARANTSKQAAL